MCLYKWNLLDSGYKGTQHIYLVTLFKLHKHRVVYLIITRTSFLNGLITLLQLLHTSDPLTTSPSIQFGGIEGSVI